MKNSYKNISLLLFAATSISLSAQTSTFNYTGGVQTYVVPPCVTSIAVNAYGAQGGGPNGGLGGRAIATVPVTPGSTLYIYVGGQPTTRPGAGSGGYNGGGAVNALPCGGGTNDGWGGGGASDIRTSVSLTTRIIVAGGGGGQGWTSGLGGAGGGLNGSDGAASWIAGTQGFGATQSAGGAGGFYTGNSQSAGSGSLGLGGDAGPVNTYCIGGGGGGGYYGGGGGYVSAGAGGSSYISYPGSTSTSTTSGFRAGNGQIVITAVPGTPASPSSITGATNICTGATASFSISSVVGATSYTWTVPAGATINSGQGTTSINVTFASSSGNISVTADNACGSSSATNLAITIIPPPTVTANTTASTICAGGSVTLTGGGASTYTWTGGVTNGVSFIPTLTNTYTVTGTDGNGCTNTASTTVTVNPAPTVTANSTSSAVCAGGSVTLTGGGATSYSWTGGITDAVAFVPTVTTTYTVTGMDGNGCTNSASTTVTVNSLPTVTANSTSSAVCAGSSVILTGGGATTYTWTGGVTDGISFVPTISDTYTVTGTDGNGCVNTASAAIIINALPVVALGSDQVQCGGTVMFDAGNAGSTYLWSDASTTQTITLSASGTVYVDVTDANGCMGSDTAMATINAFPTVDLGLDVTQCGGTVMLDAGNVGSTYLWNNTTTNQTVTVSASGTFYVDVTDVNGCTGSDTATVTINTPPTVTGTAASSVVCVDDASVTLTGTPVGGTWSGPGVTGSSFSPTSAGVGAQTATYSFTDVNNCTATAMANIQVNACVGVVESSLTNSVNVFPNPNAGSFTLSVNANMGDLLIEMVDLQGRVVFSSIENNVQAGFTKQISLENVSNGVYILRLTTSGEQRLEKISVQQ